MSAKTIVASAALVFVGVSLVVLAVRELGGRTDQHAGRPTGTEGRDSPQVIAYFFHGNTRCETCNNIEAYARDALETGFSGELKSGRIEWQVANFDEPENEHFKDEFDLIASSVVLVAIDGDDQVDFKDLHKVWILADDRDALVEYVRSEVEAFLRNAG